MGYWIVLAAIVEKIFISPLNCFGEFIENDLTICLWVTKTFELNGCFMSKDRIMPVISFLGSNSYQAPEQSSSKFLTKMKVHFQWFICFVTRPSTKLSTLT